MLIFVLFVLTVSQNSQECLCQCACCSMDLFDRIQNTVKNQVTTNIFDIEVNSLNFLDVSGGKLQIEHL